MSKQSSFGTRLLFIIGVLLVAFSAYLLILDESEAKSSIAFLMGLLLLVFANLSRFKRFKGLGFEAELWEEKQEEAASLIDQLKSLVEIYSTELVLSRVEQGRWGGSKSWREHWEFYDRLVKEHEGLGQTIDFTNLKNKLDTWFLFDLDRHLYPNLGQRLSNAAVGIKHKAKASSEFNGKKYREMSDKLQALTSKLNPSKAQASSENIARQSLEQVQLVKAALLEEFGVDVEIDELELRKLEIVANAFDERPVIVTEKLLKIMDPA